MQIVEQTGFGIRTAAIPMHLEGHPRFLLLPMLHLASPKFFKQVRSQLETCDIIVDEGVRGRRTRLLTLSYRIAGRWRRGGLVEQGKGLDLSGLTARMVHPDLAAAEFAEGWTGVPLAQRALLLLLAPLFGVWMLIVGPERALMADLNMDDLPTREQEARADATPEIDEALLGRRDRALCQAIIQLAADEDPSKVVGICWGAEHMRAVLQALISVGYRPRGGGTWMTAISFVE